MTTTIPVVDIAAPAMREVGARPKLRVALFSGNYNYVMDGPVRALNKLVAHLEEEGHDVLVFAPTAAKAALEHVGTLISAPSVPFPGRGEYRFALGMSTEIKKRLREFKPTLIHVAAPDLLGLGALNYGRRHSIPAVASFHTRFDTYPRYYNMQWLEGSLTRYLRYFYDRCEQVYAPSESMAEELREDGIGRDIRLWTRGVDSDLFSPDKRDLAWRRSIGFKEDDVVAAFVGRLVLEKGIDIFVEALAKSNTVKALVVGEGPERAQFEKKLPSGHFTGFLDGADLARAYASADIFFNPSITETFGNVTLEAMASGAPPLCANAAGSASLVRHGETGLLAAPDVTEFSKALDRLASDRAYRKELGAAARQFSLNYSWRAVLDALIDHYYDAIARFNPEKATSGS